MALSSCTCPPIWPAFIPHPSSFGYWFVCRMEDTRRAVVVDEAMPFQRSEYLQQFPSLRLILLEPVPNTSDWLALPYNPGDMEQRFRLSMPVLLRLVDGGQPLDRVIGRVEVGTVWFDDIDNRADVLVAETLRERLEAGEATPGVQHLSPGERAAYELLGPRHAAARVAREQAEAERRVLSEREQQERAIRGQLTMAGARLVGYEIRGDGEVLVTWERGGNRRVARVDTSGNVLSAGICLSGRDRVFDLASLVGVIEDSPAFARSYAPRGWGD